MRTDRSHDEVRWEQMRRAHGVLVQIKRVRDGVVPLVRRTTELAQAGPAPRRVRPADKFASWEFWADVHFLFIAAHHLDRILKVSDDSLPEGLGRLNQVRHLLEHWDKAGNSLGAWKGLRDDFGEFGTPMSIEFDPESNEILLSSYRVSLNELERATRAIFDRLQSEEASD